MPIGLTDILVPLGSFPLVEDTSTKGGFRAVANIAARDAIASVSLKAGMLVWAEEEGSMWQLGSDLTTWAPFSSGGGLTPGGDLTGDSTTQEVVGVRRMQVIDKTLESVDITKTLTPLVKGGDVLQHTEGSSPLRVLQVSTSRTAVMRRRDVVVFDHGSLGSVFARRLVPLIDPQLEGSTEGIAFAGSSIWVYGSQGGLNALWKIDLTTLEATLYPVTLPTEEGEPHVIGSLSGITGAPTNDRVWLVYNDSSYNRYRLIEINTLDGATVSARDFPDINFSFDQTTSNRDTVLYFGGANSAWSAVVYRLDTTSGYGWSVVPLKADEDLTSPLTTVTGLCHTASSGSAYFPAVETLLVVADDSNGAELGAGGICRLTYPDGVGQLDETLLFPVDTWPMDVAVVLGEATAFVYSDGLAEFMWVTYAAPQSLNTTMGRGPNTTPRNDCGIEQLDGLYRNLIVNGTAEYVGMIENGLLDNGGSEVLRVGSALAFEPYMYLAGRPLSPITDPVNYQGATPVLRGNSFTFEVAGALSGPAGGDLTGTYPNPVVNGIQKSPIINEGLYVYSNPAGHPPSDLAGNVSGMAVVKGNAQVQPSIISLVDWSEFWVILKDGKGVVHVTQSFSEGGGVDRVNTFYRITSDATADLYDVLYDQVNHAVWVVGTENFGEGRVWKIDLNVATPVVALFKSYPTDFLCTGVSVDVYGQLWVNIEVVGGASYASMLNPVTGNEITTVTYDYYGDFHPHSAAMAAESNGYFIWLAGWLYWDGLQLACAYQIEVATQTGSQIQVGGHTRQDPLLDVTVTSNRVYMLGRKYMYQFDNGGVTAVGLEYQLPQGDNPARISAVDGYDSAHDYVHTLNGYGGESVSGYMFTNGESPNFTPFTPNSKVLLPSGAASLDFCMTGAEDGWVTFADFDEVSSFTYTGMGNRIGVGSFFTVGKVDSLAGYQVPSSPSIYDIGKVLTFTGVDFKLMNAPGLLVGEIRAWTGASAPPGWVICEGQELDRNVYDVLNGLYFGQGYPFGDGDGVSTFNVPDARGRTLVGAGTPVAPLTTSRYMGDKVGEESVTLSAYTSGMPSHSHTIQDSGHDHYVDLGSHTHTFTGTSHYHNISPNPHSHTVGVSAYESVYTGTAYVQGGNSVGASGAISFTTSETSLSVGAATAGGTNDSAYLSTYSAYHTSGISLDSAYADAGGAHENMQPSLVVNYIVYTGVAITEIVPVG